MVWSVLGPFNCVVTVSQASARLQGTRVSLVYIRWVNLSFGRRNGMSKIRNRLVKHRVSLALTRCKRVPRFGVMVQLQCRRNRLILWASVG